VRAQLCDAALQNERGADVLMLATDGLFCRETRDLPLGEDLGQWSFDEHSSMFIVQSGVYFLPETSTLAKTKSTKTRGIPQSKVIAHERDFRQVWSEYLAGGELAPVEISLHNFIGLRLANARHAYDTAGTWVDVPKRISFDWSSKRAGGELVGTRYVAGMIGGSFDLESVAYNKVIGGIRAAERLAFADQPDWGDVL
jgi:hypothetical protein